MVYYKSDILIKTGKHQYITWWQCLKLNQSKGYTFQGFQIEKNAQMSIPEDIGATDIKY